MKSFPINWSTCGWQNGASFFQREAELTGPRSAPLIWIFTRVKRGARLGAARFALWTQFKRGRHIKESDEKVEDPKEHIKHNNNCNDHYGRLRLFRFHSGTSAMSGKLFRTDPFLSSPADSPRLINSLNATLRAAQRRTNAKSWRCTEWKSLLLALMDRSLFVSRKSSTFSWSTLSADCTPCTRNSSVWI